MFTDAHISTLGYLWCNRTRANHDYKLHEIKVAILKCHKYIFFYGSLMRGIICLKMYTQDRSYKRLRNVVTLKLRKEKQRYFNEQLRDKRRFPWDL